MPAPDSQVDTRGYTAVSYTMDFCPTTLAEEAEHNGLRRTNAPVGNGSNSEYVNPFAALRAADEIADAARMTKNQRW